MQFKHFEILNDSELGTICFGKEGEASDKGAVILEILSFLNEN